MLREFLNLSIGEKVWTVLGITAITAAWGGVCLAFIWGIFWLYGVGLVPLGAPAMGFWQFCAVWIFLGFVAQFFRPRSKD
jgi:hypothetical protein